MRILQKSSLIAIVMVLTISSVSSQSNSDLLGKWETIYEDNGNTYVVTYEFKNVDKTVKAYSILIKDGQNGAEKDNSIAMDEVQLKSGKGNAKYIIADEGKIYEMNAKLNMKDQNTLEVRYSYWGYSDTEIWKRIK